MLGFHKQMDNRIKLLEEILSYRMQGVEFDNGDMYVDGHKAASDVRDEFVSVTEKLMDELAQCYNVLPFLFSSSRRHTRSLCDWSSDVCSSDLDAFQGTGPSLGANPFQGALPFTKKRELSPGLPPASPGSVALPHWTPRGAHLRHSGFGDLNPTPFRSAEGNGGHRPSLRNGARPSLRTD